MHQGPRIHTAPSRTDPRPGNPRVVVLIPTVDGPRWLPACLAALDGQRFRDFRIVVIDDGDGRSAAWLAGERPDVTVLLSGGRRGFAGAVNAGLDATREPFVALLNDDARPEPAWLGALMDAIEDPRRMPAFVCGKVVADDDPGRLDSVGDGMSRWLLPYPIGRFECDRGQYDDERPILLAPGSAAVFRRHVFEDAGPLEASFFAYLEDVDLGLRAAWRGHEGWYVPGAVARHVGSATTGGMINPFTVRRSTCNLLRVQVRNLPARILLRGCWRVAAGHAYWFAKMAIKERQPLAWLRGAADGLRRVPRDLRARRRLAARRRIDPARFCHRLRASATEVRQSIGRKRADIRRQRPSR